MNQEQNPVKQPDKAAQLTNILTQALQLLRVMQSPYMTPEKFGESIGLSKGVVGGWIDLGYLPTVKIGKYRMINLIAINADLIRQLFEELNLDDLIVVMDYKEGVVL